MIGGFLRWVDIVFTIEDIVHGCEI